MTPNTNPDTQLRQSLLTLAADISANHQPQPAAILWLRAQLRERHSARQQAIARATLPLRLMSAIGILAAVLTAAFALHQSWTSPTANPAALRTLLTWTIPAAALVLVGCYILLRSARPPTHHLT
jgi:hypothetical protein